MGGLNLRYQKSQIIIMEFVVVKAVKYCKSNQNPDRDRLIMHDLFKSYFYYLYHAFGAWTLLNVGAAHCQDEDVLNSILRVFQLNKTWLIGVLLWLNNNRHHETQFKELHYFNK